MQSFVYDTLPARVVFGSGTVAQIELEAERLGVHRVLVLSTPGRGEAQAREIAGILGELSVGVYPGAVMHTRGRYRAGLAGGSGPERGCRPCHRRRVDHRTR